jgi:hypothetical protein
MTDKMQDEGEVAQWLLATLIENLNQRVQYDGGYYGVVIIGHVRRGPQGVEVSQATAASVEPQALLEVLENAKRSVAEGEQAPEVRSEFH